MHVREHGVDLPADHIGQGRPHALVGNVDEIDSRHRLQQLGREVRRRACAGRTIIE
jgi:hypothetical protein